jgi:hypothetical protein
VGTPLRALGESSGEKGLTSGVEWKDVPYHVIKACEYKRSSPIRPLKATIPQAT